MLSGDSKFTLQSLTTSKMRKKQSKKLSPIFHIISKQNHHCLIMIMIHLIWLIEKVDRLDFILWIWNADADVVICVARLLHLCFRPSVLAIRPIKSIQFTPFCCCLLLSAILRAVGARGQFPPPPSNFGRDSFKTYSFRASDRGSLPISFLCLQSFKFSKLRHISD